MPADPTVYVDQEQARTFTSLQEATDYAMTRARPERAVIVVDEHRSRYLIVKYDPAWTITLTREL